MKCFFDIDRCEYGVKGKIWQTIARVRSGHGKTEN